MQSTAVLESVLSEILKAAPMQPVVSAFLGKSSAQVTGPSVWVKEVLIRDKYVDPMKAVICEQLLLSHNITSWKALASLSFDEMTCIVDSAKPKLTVGLRKHMMRLYEETAAAHRSTETIGGALKDASVSSDDVVISKYKKMEAEDKEL